MHLSLYSVRARWLPQNVLELLSQTLILMWNGITSRIVCSALEMILLDFCLSLLRIGLQS